MKIYNIDFNYELYVNETGKCTVRNKITGKFLIEHEVVGRKRVHMGNKKEYLDDIRQKAEAKEAKFVNGSTANKSEIITYSERYNSDEEFRESELAKLTAHAESIKRKNIKHDKMEETLLLTADWYSLTDSEKAMRKRLRRRMKKKRYEQNKRLRDLREGKIDLRTGKRIIN